MQMNERPRIISQQHTYLNSHILPLLLYLFKLNKGILRAPPRPGARTKWPFPTPHVDLIRFILFSFQQACDTFVITLYLLTSQNSSVRKIGLATEFIRVFNDAVSSSGYIATYCWIIVNNKLKRI
jgi:hypothetical protein